MATDLKLYDPDLDDERAHEDAVLEKAREKCRQSIRSQIASSQILGSADCDVYEQVMSDKGLALVNKHRLEDKLAYIREVERSMVPKLLSEANALEREFTVAIEQAVSAGWINAQKGRWWMNQLKDKSVAFHKKHFFIKTDDGTGMKDPKLFRVWIKKWGEVAEYAKQLRKHPRVKQLSTKDVPNLSTFLDEKQFLNLSYQNRSALVKTVDAALTAKERQMPQLYTKAKAMLDAAAQRQAISSSKVGAWLQRIFHSGAKGAEIDDFLNNRGSMPLQKMIENWAEASKHFHKIEAKRKALGSPRGFTFVSMNVFLNWKYDKRTAYLQEAEHRFTDINKEPELFLQIRHELGAKDWEAADDLLQKAKGQEWGKENQRKLRTMEQFLKHHRTEEERKIQEQNPSAWEIVSEMESLIQQLPHQLRRLYTSALNRGYQAFWVLTTIMYNRDWCWKHNYLDAGKERDFEQRANRETEKHIEHGHKKFGWETNTLKGKFNTRPAVRDQSGVRGAQTLFTDEQSTETLLTEIDEQKNDRNFWYWTSMIPEGVQYAEHVQIIQTLHPRMKKLARMMQERGIQYRSPMSQAGVEKQQREKIRKAA